MDGDLKAWFQAAGRSRIVVSHALGAADHGRYALVKVALFGGAVELYALPAGLAYWLIDRIDQAIAAGAIRDRRSRAESGSPEAMQIKVHGANRPEIAPADWEIAGQRIVTGIRAHAFGNALGLQARVDGNEAALIVPDQVAIMLHESLILAASYLVDRTHAPASHSEH